jgi:signal transduction histidine kinase
MTAYHFRRGARTWQWWGSLLLDLALAGFSTAFGLALYNEVLAGKSPTALGLLVVVLHGGCLVARRKWPMGVLTVVLATAAVYTLVLNLPVFMLGPGALIAVYTVASRLPRPRSLQLLLLAEVGLALLILVGPSFPDFTSLSLFILLLAAAWFLGDLARRWRTAAEMHEARAAELAAAREELARLAVSEERLRIARELHDVVAHSMTVVALQAGSGRIAARDDPEAARSALETIEVSSREALADMRRLVGVLRGGEEAATQPAPGISDIDRLVEEMDRAGLTVDVMRRGETARLPAGLSLAVYRIVQEALTNVVRHAGVDHVRLSLECSDDELSVIVENGPPTRPVDHIEGGGHGLAGMRERASIYGGSLTTAPLEGGGYQVHARFPLPVTGA